MTPPASGPDPDETLTLCIRCLHVHASCASRPAGVVFLDRRQERCSDRKCDCKTCRCAYCIGGKAWYETWREEMEATLGIPRNAPLEVVERVLGIQ